MHNKTKNKILIATVAIGLAACIAAISIIFAWMTQEVAIKKMGFSLEQLSCTVDLYEGIDSNFNGVPDLLGVGNEGIAAGGQTASETTSTYGQYRKDNSWTDYNKLYYGEKYAFEYVDTRYMLTNDDTSANVFSEVMIGETDVEPSRIYTFKFSVTNESKTSGTLSFAFEEYDFSLNSNTDETSSKDILTNFQCRLYAVDKGTTATDEGIITAITEWTDFSSTGTSLATDSDNVTIGAKNTDSTTNDETHENIKDVWLLIKMKDEATEAKYTGQGIEVIFPYFRITFNSNSSSSSTGS